MSYAKPQRSNIPPPIIATAEVEFGTSGNSNTLEAPIACFDEGFSSDGAFLSGAETDKDATPTDHESDNTAGDRTPNSDLPRLRNNLFPNTGAGSGRSGTNQPETIAASKHGGGDTKWGCFYSDQDHMMTYSQSEEDASFRAPSSSIGALASKEHLHNKPHEEELMGENLLENQDSDEDDNNDYLHSGSSYSGFNPNSIRQPVAITTSITGSMVGSTIGSYTQSAPAPTAYEAYSGSNSISISSNAYGAAIMSMASTTAMGSGSQNGSGFQRPTNITQDQQRFNEQIRWQYEAQALTRPRSTTPVRSSVLESFVAQEEKRPKPVPSPAEKMQICIPGHERQSRGRSRHGTKSWLEFQENMTVNLPGRLSGRSTPTGPAGVDFDLFDQSNYNRQNVPPSPVVHRRSSREWTMFADEDSTLEKPWLNSSKNAKYATAICDSSASSYASSSAEELFSSPSRDFSDTPEIGGGPSAPPPALLRYAPAAAAFAASKPPPTVPPLLPAVPPVLAAYMPSVTTDGSFVSTAAATISMTSSFTPMTSSVITSSPMPVMPSLSNTAVFSGSDSSAATQAPPKQPADVKALLKETLAKMDEPLQKQLQKEKEDEQKKLSSDDWREFQRITQKVTEMVKQTQERMQEIEQTTAVKSLKMSKYENYRDPSAPARTNLLDTDIIEPASKTSEPATVSGNEWKPIHEVLNEEIKREREKLKPQRPPPPRPPPRAPGIAGSTAMPTWDDEPSAPPPPAPPASYARAPTEPSRAPPSVIPSWDDDAATYYASVAGYVGASQQDSVMSTSEGTEPLPSYAQYDAQMDYPAPTEGQCGNDDSYLYGTTTEADTNYNSVQQSCSDFPEPPPEDILNQWKEQQQTLFENNAYTFGAATVLKSDVNSNTKLSENVNNGHTTEEGFDSLKCNGSIASGVPPPTAAVTRDWSATFENARLPSSGSEFFAKFREPEPVQLPTQSGDPFAPMKQKDLLTDGADQEYDPFEVKPVEAIIAEVKEKAQAQISAQSVVDDLDFFGLSGGRPNEESSSDVVSCERPNGFEDEFHVHSADRDSPSPLFDEDDSLPLPEFPLKFTGDGWEMMIRHPIKKKIMGERYWKPVYVRLRANCILLYHSKTEKNPFQELPLQAMYCLSDVTLQQYDIYGKIHTVKLQFVVYKERVGLRPGQIPKLVEGQFTKLGLPLEHSAQSTQLLKFGSLNHADMQTFVRSVEDVLFKTPIVREGPQQYKQDEVQVHVYEEYSAAVSKEGALSDQRARVRVFCLVFVSGMPMLEIGLNDRWRQGKEVVRRKDIMPMYTERWIRLEQLELHSCVDVETYNRDHAVRLQPMDGCFFELLRFRVRPPKGKENPLHVRAIMKLAGSKIEIRIECMVAAFRSRKARQIPCEDIQVRFPIPEAWIYLFREERHWGYGSVHAQKKRPGKVKNLTDRLMGVVKNTENSLIEVAIGDAKYEHVYRSLVWRIPRLPEKHHGAYKTHLLRCRFQLSSFDLMPETFLPNCEVEFTMPMATVSHTVVRSVSIEQHEDPDTVEKWVRYVAKYQQRVEVDYVQTTELDIDSLLDPTNMEPEKALEKVPEIHRPEIDVNATKAVHEGYRIDFSAEEIGGARYDQNADNSSDSEDEKQTRKPKLLIDIKGFEPITTKSSEDELQ